ncbi:hypothetical protein L6267_03925 [Candidatus Parcubacteria bacterium]|nr:hypothetical protein [Candidatus Parcubacteria bacterium]
MKRIIFFCIILFCAIALSGCGSKDKDMGQLSEDNSYHYGNKDLGFEMALPTEFEYYQAQRKETPDYIDIEIFVPTSDIDYPQEVPGYAKPIVVRIFESSVWQSIGEDNEDKIIYKKAGEKKDKIYTIKFWDQIPKDWQGKWSEGMGDGIMDGFIIK